MYPQPKFGGKIRKNILELSLLLLILSYYFKETDNFWYGHMFCLPFQNLTEFNTAHNRRNIALTDLKDVANPLKRKHRSVHVSFSEDEEIINPGKYVCKLCPEG